MVPSPEVSYGVVTGRSPWERSCEQAEWRGVSKLRICRHAGYPQRKDDYPRNNSKGLVIAKVAIVHEAA